MSSHLRIGARLAALATLVLLCVPVHCLWAATGRPNPVPRFFLSRARRIVGIDIRCIGQPASAPLLLLANHVSWMDILALAEASGTAFVAHDGLAGHPLLRWLLRQNRTIFVARQDRASVSGQARELREALDRGRVLTLFPEGTTGDGVSLLPFKSSLLAAVELAAGSVVVQPVLLDYGADAAAIAWTGNEPGLANARRILGLARPVTVTLSFLPPLTSAECASRKVMAAAARARIAAALDSRLAPQAP